MSRQALITTAALFAITLIAAVTIGVFFFPVSIPGDGGTVAAYKWFIGAFGLAGLGGIIKLRRRKDD